MKTSILHFSMQSENFHQSIATYYPPYSNQHPLTNAMFLDDITERLSNILPKYNNIILGGDFNLHVNDHLDINASTFIESTEGMDLQQLVCSPTHKSGNILDLIFTEITETVKVANIRNGPFLSDHCTVDFEVLSWKEEPTTQYTTYRKIKLFDMEAVMEELSEMENNPNNSDLSQCILSLEKQA